MARSLLRSIIATSSARSSAVESGSRWLSADAAARTIASGGCGSGRQGTFVQRPAVGWSYAARVNGRRTSSPLSLHSQLQQEGRTRLPGCVG
jgi:hypothetical protein